MKTGAFALLAALLLVPAAQAQRAGKLEVLNADWRVAQNWLLQQQAMLARQENWLGQQMAFLQPQQMGMGELVDDLLKSMVRMEKMLLAALADNAPFMAGGINIGLHMPHHRGHHHRHHHKVLGAGGGEQDQGAGPVAVGNQAGKGNHHRKHKGAGKQDGQGPGGAMGGGNRGQRSNSAFARGGSGVGSPMRHHRHHHHRGFGRPFEVDITININEFMGGRAGGMTGKGASARRGGPGSGKAARGGDNCRCKEGGKQAGGGKGGKGGPQFVSKSGPRSGQSTSSAKSGSHASRGSARRGGERGGHMAGGCMGGGRSRGTSLVLNIDVHVNMAGQKIGGRTGNGSSGATGTGKSPTGGTATAKKSTLPGGKAITKATTGNKVATRTGNNARTGNGVKTGGKAIGGALGKNIVKQGQTGGKMGKGNASGVTNKGAARPAAQPVLKMSQPKQPTIQHRTAPRSGANAGGKVGTVRRPAAPRKPR